MKLGTFCLIQDDKNRILLCLRRDKDLWNLPGGGVEEGENPWEAVVREAKEEIGVDIEVVKLQGIFHKPKQDEIVFQFVARIIKGEPSLSDEVREIRYFNLEDIPENTAPMQLERIKMFYSSKEEFTFYTH